MGAIFLGDGDDDDVDGDDDDLMIAIVLVCPIFKTLNFSMSAPTVEECRSQCEIQKSCRLFTFNSANANCRC